MVDSLSVGSLLEEAAFTSILRILVRRHPNLPVAHIPPQLLVTWQRVAEHQDEDAAEAAMLAWCEQSADKIRTASYLVLHWVDGHYCSLVLDVEVWRRGPGAAVLQSAATAIAASTSSGVQPSSRRKRKVPAVEWTLSTSQERVPFLHLDTLPDACGFAEQATRDTMLMRVCRVFNRFYNTAWPAAIASLPQLVHLCGPPQQKDGWSCGYHLLWAWSRLLQTGLPWIPQRITEACAPMTMLSVEQLVQDARAQHQATSASAVRKTTANAGLFCYRVAGSHPRR